MTTEAIRMSITKKQWKRMILQMLDKDTVTIDFPGLSVTLVRVAD